MTDFLLSSNAIGVMDKYDVSLDDPDKFSKLINLIIKKGKEIIGVYGKSSEAFLEDDMVDGVLDLSLFEIIIKNGFEINIVKLNEIQNVYILNKKGIKHIILPVMSSDFLYLTFSKYIPKELQKEKTFAIVYERKHFYTVVKEENSIRFDRVKGINETNSYKWTCGLNAILNLLKGLDININKLGIEKNDLDYILTPPERKNSKIKSEDQNVKCCIC